MIEEWPDVWAERGGIEDLASPFSGVKFVMSIKEWLRILLIIEELICFGHLDMTAIMEVVTANMICTFSLV